MLCRDCCCGTTKKHPRTDHEGQQLALEAAAADNPAVELRIVDCLDECDRSNVAVVRRPSAARKDRDTWLGGLLIPSATEALAEWVRDGAQGLPPRMEAHVFRHVPPRKKR
jgi:predicted metal-binding protein